MFELICKYKVGYVIHGTVIKEPIECSENAEIVTLIAKLFQKIVETELNSGIHDYKILEISIKRIKE